MWPEVQVTKAEQRHELVLQGKELSEKIDSNAGAVDDNIFSLGLCEI